MRWPSQKSVREALVKAGSVLKIVILKVLEVLYIILHIILQICFYPQEVTAEFVFVFVCVILGLWIWFSLGGESSRIFGTLAELMKALLPDMSGRLHP